MICIMDIFQMCNKSLIETEFHFFAECYLIYYSYYYSFARRNYFDRLYSKFPKVRNLSIFDQILFIFICEDEDIISATLEMMIGEHFSQRKKLSSLRNYIA